MNNGAFIDTMDNFKSLIKELGPRPTTAWDHISTFKIIKGEPM